MISQNNPGRRGCLFYGGLVAGVFLLLLLLGLAFGITMARKLRTQFTDAAPVPLPKTEVTTTEYQALQNRLNSFMGSLTRGDVPPPLELSAHDLNALIDHDDELKVLRGKLHVILDGDRASGQLSIPMAEIGLPVFRDRYLNAVAKFHVSLRDGSLKLAATNITVHGSSLPRIYVDEISQVNLGSALNTNTAARPLLDRIGAVQITNSLVRIIPKGD
jgi:hypothetical protein